MGRRWVRWEWRSAEWTFPILTINGMGRSLETDHVLESQAPLACLVRISQAELDIHPLVIDPEVVRDAYFMT